MNNQDLKGLQKRRTFLARTDEPGLNISGSLMRPLVDEPSCYFTTCEGFLKRFVRSYADSGL